MVGLIQILIYLFCIYLIYKGVEIFQIAFVTNEAYRQRKLGIVIGIILTVVAVCVSLIAFIMTENIVERIGNNIPKYP